jgi:hypothetical protein
MAFLQPGGSTGSRGTLASQTPPPDMTVLPHLKAHVVVVANANNRTLRYMDVMVPMESRAYDRAELVRVWLRTTRI